MKVLVLSSLAYSLTNFRGNLLRDMRANGHDVIAVAPDHDAAVEAELARDHIGFRVIPMQRAGTNPIADLQLLLRYIRLMLSERPDVVLAYTQKPIIYGGIAARILAIHRFYALMSGLGHVFGEEGRKRPVVRRVASWLYRIAVHRAAAIFVFNADDRADMIELGIVSNDQKVLRVPGSGVDLERFPAMELPRGPVSFLLIARLLRSKGIHEFTEAARRVAVDHPECKFAVLGRCDEESPAAIGLEECESLARSYPVRFIPGTSDVRPYLEGASVFVLPSYYREGLPRTILEAMATGRAVITTDVPGCRDPIEDGGNGILVPPHDANALADAMMQFVKQPGLITAMGARSRKLAESVYDVRRVNCMLLDEMDLLDPIHRRSLPNGVTSHPAPAAADVVPVPQPHTRPGQDRAADVHVAG